MGMPSVAATSWQRHAEQVIQRDDRAMARIETPKRRIDQLAVGQRARKVG